ncbi:major facilitator superfamily domain-containing protein [Ilyonectria robusta]|uniref:major facilitator superfamily domain-containing protein n=1 Tax=Ilyonectria robusta TaxID=1079257 RepID=UPI001E8E0E61|nr:major facilitator superfamily domain-containing protein [Ilyonectria robusta]KAH8650453.1 major facilitator superfamily domain-containing protein [Ilyonectria robusta]
MTRQEVRRAEFALHDQANLLPRRQLILAFATLSINMLIVAIDQNGIAVTLPTIATDLNAEATISWAGTASLLANTTFQMLYGRLSDIFGRKTIFIAAILMLSIGDLLCALSQTAVMFYICRAIAGIGGGGIVSLTNIIVSDIVTLEQRGKYQGINGAMVGLGNAVGPFLAAALIQRTSWRAFFYMLSPLGAMTACLTYFYLPSKPPTASFEESLRQVDWIGSLVSSTGVILLLIPITGGGAYFSWDSPMVISMLAIGFVTFLSFIAWEWKLAKLPMMPVEIFNNSVVVVMFLQSFLFGSVYQAYLYYIPLYLQNPHQFSVMTSAIVYIPLVIAQSLISILSGQYISRRKQYGEVIVFGFGIWTLGAGLALVFNRATRPGIIIIILLLIGTGVGSIMQPTLVALQAHSPKYRRAVIISNRNFFRSAGGACGLAVSAAVLQARLRATLPQEYKYVSDSTYALPESVKHVPAVLDAYMAASRGVFILQVPLMAICLLCTVFIRDRGLESREDHDN